MNNAVEPTPGCVLCGTSLAGVHPDAHCPRCRAPVARSRPGDALAHSDIEHIRTLRRGWLFIVVGYIVAVINAIGMVLAEEYNLLPPAAVVSLFVVSVGVTLGVLVGWWQITSPDDRIAGAHDGSAIRSWVRTSIVLYLFVVVPDDIVRFVLQPTPSAPLPTHTLAVELLLVLLSLAAAAVNLSLFLATARYLMWLAPRIPSRAGFRRASHAFKYMRNLIPCLLALTVLGFIGGLSGASLLLILVVVGALVLLFFLVVTALYHLGALYSIWMDLGKLYRAMLDEQLSPAPLSSQ